MEKIRKMAAAEFRRLSKKQQKEINSRHRIRTAPAGQVMEHGKRKEKVRRWKWDGTVS